MQSMAMRITGAGQRCRGCENIRSAATLFVGLGLQDLAATIEAVGADVVAQMGFAGGGLDRGGRIDQKIVRARSEEHTSELQSLMHISYAVFCLKQKINKVVTHIKDSTYLILKSQHITYNTQ